MSMPTFSKQLAHAIDNYETMMAYWERARLDSDTRWAELAQVGREVALRRKRLVLAIKAECRGFQHEIPTTVECLAWYDHLMQDVRPLTFKGGAE